MDVERGKRALPAETRQPLSYDELIATLRLLEGEEVWLSFGLGPEGSRLTVLGILSVYDYNWATGAAVGTARLLLSPKDDIAARLSTFDGNDFFQIAVEVGGHEFVLGDPASLGTGEFE